MLQDFILVLHFDLVLGKVVLGDLIKTFNRPSCEPYKMATAHQGRIASQAPHQLIIRWTEAQEAVKISAHPTHEEFGQGFRRLAPFWHVLLNLRAEGCLGDHCANLVFGEHVGYFTSKDELIYKV